MVLRQLEYLAALAREKHFGRAAEACQVSQPTLSAAIRLLEDDLGAPIVERYVGLTPQGQLALEHAHRILAEVENLRRGLAETDKGLTRRLRVGAIPTALPIVSQLAGPFFKRFPGVTVAVFSMNSQEIDRGIEEFELDVGLTYLDYLDAEPIAHVKTKPVCVEEYLFLTPATGGFADSSQVTWSKAATAPLCLPTPDMQNRRIIDGVFRSVGANPIPAVETNSIYNLVSHVSAGQWSAIVPRQLLRFFGVPAGTRAIELVEPVAQRTIGLVMSNREPPSPLAGNLFAMPLPSDIAALIRPPNPLAEDAESAAR
jgi:DNA-binding transcriptional LysR family regulator